MSLKSEVKKTGDGRGLLGLAIGVALGVAVLAPLFAMLWNKVATKLGWTTTAAS
ncbi:MAG: hypothetical protein ACREL1_00350 [bacterium]